jgi:NAD(P)-dependent dehydrogenase (short-subunit alcohol dehydrogenase family)
MASVLITGCSRGIGLETALAFARTGYQVHATMRNPAKSLALAETAAREKLPIVVSAMDVDSDESVRARIAAIVSAHGSIDVLVNNAGIGTPGAVEESSLAEFRAVMETNYFGALRCIKAVLPQMRERKSGCIINVSSVAGQISNPPLTAYCASKWALEALSEGLAGEMKTFNVRVALVEPGIIDTDMARELGDEHEAAKKSHYGQTARFEKMFIGALQNDPTPSTLVADLILNIAQSGTWKFRHLAGPGAGPLLEMRAAMTDEAWIELQAGDDEAFFKHMAGPKDRD